jgi:hypothetical protein
MNRLWACYILGCLAVLGICNRCVAQADDATTPRLFCGTDATGFSGENGQLAVVTTSGPLIISTVHVYDLDVPLNGITNAGKFLWTGQPNDVGTSAGNTLRKVSWKLPPAVLSTLLPGTNSFNPSCCDEQMVTTPSGFYHAHYDDVIQLLTIDSSGKSEVKQTFAQSDTVGMAYDGVNIWISKFAGQSVGTWDPVTNVFTPVFSTPADAAGLAWDVPNGVLWVGMANGFVIPYDARGNQLGPGFAPFGKSEDIDGLAFIAP